MHLSIRPELHALASAWVSAAEDTASRKAVSLNARMDLKKKRTLEEVEYLVVNQIYIIHIYVGQI